MRMRQQLIIVVAVVFATVAVGVNVYAATRTVDQSAHRLAVDFPVASVLDRGVLDDPPIETTSPDSEDRDDAVTTAHPENHGMIVSAYAKHIGWDHIAGPPGLLVRDIARPDGKDDKQPPGLSKDDKQPPGLSKDDKQPPGQNKDT